MKLAWSNPGRRGDWRFITTVVAAALAICATCSHLFSGGSAFKSPSLFVAAIMIPVVLASGSSYLRDERSLVDPLCGTIVAWIVAFAAAVAASVIVLSLLVVILAWTIEIDF